MLPEKDRQPHPVYLFLYTSSRLFCILENQQKTGTVYSDNANRSLGTRFFQPRLLFSEQRPAAIFMELTGDL